MPARPDPAAPRRRVDADDAGPLARPSPAASTTSGTTRAAYVQDDSTNANAPNPAAPRPKPATMANRVPMRAASGVINGVTAIIAGSRGKRRHARLERAHPEGRRILEVEAEDVHQAVDRARHDQDRQRRADEHLVAEQAEIDERGGHALLDDHEEHGADDGGDEASERRRRRPAPVAALAEREHERNEGDRDQERAGVVDRAGPRRGRATPAPWRASAGCTRPRSQRRARTGPASRSGRRALRR